MTDDTTEPNLRANTPRNLFLRGLRWAKAHPEAARLLVVAAACLAIGKWLL